MVLIVLCRCELVVGSSGCVDICVCRDSGIVRVVNVVVNEDDDGMSVGDNVSAVFRKDNMKLDRLRNAERSCLRVESIFVGTGRK